MLNAVVRQVQSGFQCEQTGDFARSRAASTIGIRQSMAVGFKTNETERLMMIVKECRL